MYLHTLAIEVLITAVGWREKKRKKERSIEDRMLLFHNNGPDDNDDTARERERIEKQLMYFSLSLSFFLSFMPGESLRADITMENGTGN